MLKKDAQRSPKLTKNIEKLTKNEEKMVSDGGKSIKLVFKHALIVSTFPMIFETLFLESRFPFPC